VGKVEKVSECDIQYRGGSKVFVSCYSERKRKELKAKWENGREGGKDAEKETCHGHGVEKGRPQLE